MEGVDTGGNWAGKVAGVGATKAEEAMTDRQSVANELRQGLAMLRENLAICRERSASVRASLLGAYVHPSDQQAPDNAKTRDEPQGLVPEAIHSLRMGANDLGHIMADLVALENELS